MEMKQRRESRGKSEGLLCEVVAMAVSLSEALSHGGDFGFCQHRTKKTNERLFSKPDSDLSKDLKTKKK